MKKFKYFSITDPRKEAIGIFPAHDHENAIKLASEIKCLSMDEFLGVFSVQEIIYESKKCKNKRK